jgi:hypothetical protein
MTIPTAPEMTAEILLAETGTSWIRTSTVPRKLQQDVSPAAHVGSSTGISGESLSFDAEWLNVVEQRILASLPPEGYSVKGNTAWLQPDVASAALDFFKRTSTALPSEPYIYSSQAGDLVAEFPVSHGKMTCIVSTKFVLVFAAVREEVVQKKLLRTPTSLESIRSEIQAVTQLFNAGTNGKVGSKR